MIERAREKHRGYDGYERLRKKLARAWLKLKPGCYVVHLWHEKDCPAGSESSSHYEPTCRCRWRFDTTPVNVGDWPPGFKKPLNPPIPAVCLRHLAAGEVVELEDDQRHWFGTMATVSVDPSYGFLSLVSRAGNETSIDHDAREALIRQRESD